MTIRGFDLFAVAASLVSLAMAGAYAAIMLGQDDQPRAWVLVALIGAATLAAIGAPTGFRRRRVALLVAGAMLGLLGLLAIFSIGLPILAAGVLAIVAAVRQPQPVG